MTVLSSNEPEQAQAAQNLVGPGARLRKERESQGLDQVRVASQLHLSETMIEALEWDDFEALPGAVFTQGYLRNYARLLGLPEGEIMAAYQQLNPGGEQKQLSAKGTMQIKQEVRSSHGLVRLMTWVIVIGLVALLFFWWQGRFGWQAEPLDHDLPDVQSMDEGFLPEEPIEALSETVEPYLESFGTRPEQVDVPPESQPEIQPEAFATPADVPAVAPEAETQPEAVTDQRDAGLTEEQIAPVQEAPAEVEVPPQPAPAPSGGGQWVFEFDGRCWAEVRDATGKALIIGEKRAGYRQAVDADLGPFKVVLGDASVVRLTLNGEPYDLAPHTRGNVARFTLEAE